MILPKDFKEQMEQIEREYADDTEVAHAKADFLMCEILSEMGYQEGVKVFKDMPKWYA